MIQAQEQPGLPTATEEIWASMSRDLAAFIRRRVNDAEAAADILQETFVRIHDGIGSLRDEDRLAAWVFRIARNAIVDHTRRRKPEAALEVEPVSGEETDPANLNITVGRWLVEMIEALPGDYREAMNLVEGEGLTQQQVADRIGLSLSGAKSRVQRGRAMLREMLLQCCHIDLDHYGNVVGYRHQQGCDGCCGESGAC